MSLASLQDISRYSMMAQPEQADLASPSEAPINLTVLHHGKPHAFSLPASSTITDLSNDISTNLSIPPSYHKFIITPKPGLIKHPFPDPQLPLKPLANRKITLLAPTPSDLASLAAPTPRAPSKTKPATPSRHRDWKRSQEEATYTFHTIIPLPYLPAPERSQRYLERLRDDAGIKAAMRKHKFSVGVLTEMNPAEHTTHEGKTLGLNRNAGEVIELRLRTDAYDGYRDYKVIRKTLCHELAHNMFGEHDRNFWDLTNQIEKEVDANDWRSGGHALTNEEFYNPNDQGFEEDHIDGGGWTGGEFVLGVGKQDGRDGGKTSNVRGLGRRELMARAAEERMKKEKKAGSGDSGSAA